MTAAVVLPVVLSFCAGCYILLGARLLGSRREIGSFPLALTFVVVGIWVLGGAVELIATNYLVFSVGRLGHFVGTALVPVLILICFRSYTGRDTPAAAVVALLIVPVSSIVIAATNYWHEFMWQLPAVNAAGEFLTRPLAWGKWYLFVHSPYAYTMVIAGVLTLVLHSSAVAPIHRRGLLTLAGSALVPLIAAVAYDAGVGPDTISTLPLVFAAMLPVYAWLVIGEQVIEFTPLAYETVFQNMQDPVVVVDDQRRIISLNHGAESLLKISEKDALRSSLDSVFGDDVPEIRLALDTGKPQKIMTNTGRFLHLQVSNIEPGKAVSRGGRVLMFRDVSDVEKAQKEVLSSERLLRTLIDHSVNGILRLRWVFDDKGDRDLRCIFANAAAGRFLRAESDMMIDRSAAELIRLASFGMDPHAGESLVQQLLESAERGEILDTEALIEARGVSKWLRIIAEPVGEDVAVTFVDITDRKAKEIQMESIAWSDPLTGVLNRRGFERDAASRLSESDDDATGALLFIDLNEFKQINDRCGHQIGDQLLITAAERLRSSLRSCDIIGRPGGDEFVALVPDVNGKVAETLASRLAQSLEQPYLIGAETLYCAASIGLALYPDNANTLTGLLRAADQAMYRAKARSRGVRDIRQRDRLEKAV
ncbi:MAG: diguanylate cyclase [Gammaproteobacteria bacterium]|nr:diguanylate cyclase [Gammaproteobacteria bacterium]MDH5214927.1 diguanylate cyclase [Gammaproteobacteria bacterium]MDH5499760.1 diguanylate cyclase [Gammaproteobacteria bacterium]